MVQKTQSVSVVALALCLEVAFGVLAVHAAYPTKPLTYMVCFNPGGESDITARFQEASLQKHFGQDVVIQYKIGGGGSVGWSALVRSRPDGYTIAGHNFPHVVLQPLTRGNAGYETLDLTPIYIFESTPNILVVREDSPFTTLDDYIAYAKSHPGRVTVGGSGSHSANDLGTTRLKKAAGINVIYIPFTGSGDAVPALLGGHVQSLMTYSTTAVRYQGRFRPLAIASEKRMAVLSEVPTFRELGYEVVEGAYRGVAAPPGTPRPVVQYLADTFEKVMEEPEVVKKMNENGFVIETMGPEESAAFTQKKTDEYKVVLKELGLLKS